MFDSLVVQFVVLWAVIDPIGSVPVYLTKTIGLPLEDRRKIALKAVLISAGILLFFLDAESTNNPRRVFSAFVSSFPDFIWSRTACNCFFCAIPVRGKNRQIYIKNNFINFTF